MKRRRENVLSDWSNMSISASNKPKVPIYVGQDADRDNKPHGHGKDQDGREANKQAPEFSEDENFG